MTDRVAVIAVPPNCDSSVNVLASVVFSKKPTDAEMHQLDQDLQLFIKEPYVLITATPEFAESLQKDMPVGG